MIAPCFSCFLARRFEFKIATNMHDREKANASLSEFTRSNLLLEKHKQYIINLQKVVMWVVFLD
jgi:hypothetical protein